jgi:hypothetical protein
MARGVSGMTAPGPVACRLQPLDHPLDLIDLQADVRHPGPVYAASGQRVIGRPVVPEELEDGPARKLQLSPLDRGALKSDDAVQVLPLHNASAEFAQAKSVAPERERRVDVPDRQADMVQPLHVRHLPISCHNKNQSCQGSLALT